MKAIGWNRTKNVLLRVSACHLHDGQNCLKSCNSEATAPGLGKMTRSLSEYHSSPLRVPALFFVTIFERQCAQPRPPARPPVLKKGGVSVARKWKDPRSLGPRARHNMADPEQAKSLSSFQKMFPKQAIIFAPTNGRGDPPKNSRLFRIFCSGMAFE